MFNTNNWIKRNVGAFCALLEKNILSNKSLKCKVVFGPFRSRRLGNVLGINNIKPDICSYSCIYCPSGNKTCCSICTSNCLNPYELNISVRHKLTDISKLGEKINYIVFTGSGEPALDTQLSKEISIIREFGYKIAVFTNASLIWNKHIRENLMFADYVSIKIDTVNSDTWKKINRPHKRLRYDLILEGIKQFPKEFKGILSTETMLIKNMNDNDTEIKELAKYLNTLNTESSYFTAPVFPPEKNYAVSPDSDVLDNLKALIKKEVSKPVLLCCPEDYEFKATDDFENELLGLLAIHPVGKEAVKHFVKEENNFKILRNMIDTQIIKEVNYDGKDYYVGNIAL